MFVRGDIRDGARCSSTLIATHAIDAVVQLRRREPRRPQHPRREPFVRTNVARHAGAARGGARGGRQALRAGLDRRGLRRARPDRRVHRETPLAPNSPYAASKAAADLLVLAYHHTHGLDAVITRCSNNYGPYQFPEKLIPLMIANALDDKPLPVYGDGMQRARLDPRRGPLRGASTLALERGEPGEVYNIGGGDERPNLDVVQRDPARSPASRRVADPYVQDRPGHDRRYAIDSSKIRASSAGARGTPSSDGLARDGRLVPRQPAVVGTRPQRRVPRVLRAAVRRPAWPHGERQR